MSELTTVPSLDLTRYAGRWYEIARLPIRHEDPDATDVTAEYSLNDDGSVRVVNRCINESGEWESAEGVAEAVDATHAKLKVNFLPKGLRWLPFTEGDYWVLDVDADYETALVGSPNRRFLWLLHRHPGMHSEEMRAWLAKAAARNFDLDALIQTRHTGAQPRG